METDIWNKLPLTELPHGVALRQALLERLVKTDGHINAAERKLWHDTDRGLWSARHAEAHRGYALQIARFHRRDEPTPRLISVPTYCWMCCAFDRHRAAWQALKQQTTPALFEVTGLAQQSIDAAAKAWLSRFAPAYPGVAWSSCSGQNTRAVADCYTPNLNPPRNGRPRSLPLDQGAMCLSQLLWTHPFRG